MGQDETPEINHDTPERVSGPSLYRTRTDIVIETDNPDPDKGSHRQYFSTEKCSPEEQRDVNHKALAISVLSGLAGTAMSLTGIGALPGAAVGAAGNTAAENLRDRCRDENEKNTVGAGVSGTLERTAGVLLNSVIPGSGAVKDVVTIMPEMLIDTAADRAGDAVQQAMVVDPAIGEQIEEGGPRRLVPDTLPEMTNHQKEQMRAASQALREAVIAHAQEGQELASPARPVSTQEPPTVGGLY